MATVAKKNYSDNMRICLDPKKLNAAIEKIQFPLKTFEEVVSSIPTARVFWTIDDNCGYLQAR